MVDPARKDHHWQLGAIFSRQAYKADRSKAFGCTLVFCEASDMDSVVDQYLNALEERLVTRDGFGQHRGLRWHLVPRWHLGGTSHLERRPEVERGTTGKVLA